MDVVIPGAGRQSSLVAEFVRTGRSGLCPIIDVHGHVGQYFGGSMPSAPIPIMLARMERAGVERIVASHHVALAYDVETGNAAMAEVVSRFPDKILGYWVYNPNSGNEGSSSVHRLPGFVGLKFWPDYHRVRVTSRGYQPALRYANEHGLLVLCHCWGASPFAGPAMLAEVAAAYPSARFIAAHAGHGEWDIAAEAARKLPNFYLDLCSVPNPNDTRLEPESNRVPLADAVTPPLYGVVEYLVERAGADKILFGSDLPWYSQHFHTGAVIFARISDDARRKILRDNASALLDSAQRGRSV